MTEVSNASRNDDLLDAVLRRCENDTPCAEVSCRLAAADKAEYVLGDRDAAEKLRTTAAWWAEQHRWGQGEDA